MERLVAIGYRLSPIGPDTPEKGGGVGARHPVSPKIPHSAHGEGFSRRLRLIGAVAGLVAILSGCASSPEAARVRGEPGADPGNHGDPVVLLAPPDRVDRVYYDDPFEGPAVASEDTSQS